MAGLLDLSLVSAQIPIEQMRRPRLIRRMVIDERPRPTIRVLDRRPGVPPQITIEAHRGHALTDLIAELDQPPPTGADHRS